MDDISSCSDDEYGPLASTWGDQAKDTNADVIEAWRSLADPNAKLGPKGLGSGGLHRRGKNYKPVDEEVILKQREKTAAMRPKPKSKSGSHRREGGGGASEKKTSRSKGGNIHKKEHSQQQQPNHWNPFRSTSKPLPDSQPAWLKETASSYFRSREKSVDDSQYRVPASWGITPLPPPPPPSQQAPSSSLASPNKPSSVRFSEPITTSMTSPPPSPPSSASTANTPTFELPSRRPPPKGGKFVWLDQPLSNQPFWEQPNVTNSNKNNNQHLPDSPSPDDNKKATVTCDQNAVSWQNQDRSSTAWESQQQQQQQQHSPSKADWPRTRGGSEEKASPEQPNADWGKFSFGQTDAVADRSDTATKSSLNNNKEKPPSSKRRVRFDDSTIKPEYYEEKTETSKTTSSSPPPPSSSQTSQSEADNAWNKNDFTTDPSAYRWGDIKQNSSYNMDTKEASSGSNWGDNNKAVAATSERDKPTTEQQALSSTSNWSDTKATWQQDAAGWNDTPRWNDATAAARSKTEWGNDTSSAAGWNTSSSNDNWVTTTSSTSWSANKNDNKYTNQEATPQRFSKPERPKYSKRGSTPLPVNYRQDVPIAPPKEVAPPPSAENPIIISINVELRPGQKIPVNIRLLDDTNHLAQKFATDHNITAPPIVDALRQLFSSQKRIAMKKRSRKL